MPFENSRQLTLELCPDTFCLADKPLPLVVSFLLLVLYLDNLFLVVLDLSKLPLNQSLERSELLNNSLHVLPIALHTL